MKGFGSLGSDSRVFILAYIIIIITIIIISCDHRVAAGDFVSTICSGKPMNQTPICNQTLRSPVVVCGGNKITINDTNLRCVARLVNKIAINETEKVRDLANKINNGTGKGKQKINPAKSCASLCKTAIENLKLCSTYLNLTGRWNINNLQTYAGGAETNIDTCNNEFTGSRKMPDSLAAATRKAMGIVSVLVAMANMLKN